MNLEELVTRHASMLPSPADSLLRGTWRDDLPLVALDPALGAALIENLFMLVPPTRDGPHPITWRPRTLMRDRKAVLEISTTAPGYRSENMLGAGAVLSLRSARGIVEAHGGSLEVSVDPAEGIRLTVMLR